MKLFFETTAQAVVFLAMVPVGFLIAACADLSGLTGRSKPMWDILTALLGCAAVAAAVILLRDESLRMYHLLAVLTGAILYLFGVRRIAAAVSRKLREMSGKKIQHQAGKTGNLSNDIKTSS